VKRARLDVLTSFGRRTRLAMGMRRTSHFSLLAAIVLQFEAPVCGVSDTVAATAQRPVSCLLVCLIGPRCCTANGDSRLLSLQDTVSRQLLMRRETTYKLFAIAGLGGGKFSPHMLLHDRFLEIRCVPPTHAQRSVLDES
jgi:hypothetical protein